jgi:hypothetical protein
MTDESPITPPAKPSPPTDDNSIRDPHQFTISSIFWATSFVAVYVAIVMAMFRSSERRSEFGSLMMATLVGAAPGTLAFYAWIGRLRNRAGLRRCLIFLEVAPSHRTRLIAFVGIYIVASLALLPIMHLLPHWAMSFVVGAWMGLIWFFNPGKAAKVIEVYERGLIWHTSLILWKDVASFCWFGDLLRLRLVGREDRDFILAGGQRERMTAILMENVSADARAASIPNPDLP